MKRFAGLFILLAVVGVVAVLYLRSGQRRGATGIAGIPGVVTTTPTGGAGGSGGGSAPGEVIRLTGLIGGEKTGFLKDPDVIQILRDKYGIEVDADKRGSLEMVREDQPSDRDFLWPSSQVALDLYKSSGRPMVRAEILLNSPIVLYSWEPVTEALIRKRIVEKRDNSFYIVDFPKLVQTINKGATWKDMGLPELYGRVVVYSTDPTLSNSGNMFAGLLANTLNGGQVATEDSLTKALPELKKFFDDQGYMEQSSDTIFKQFLAKGMGDKAIIIGYESQIIEYRRDADPRFQSRQKEIRLLYPQPTVWSSHPLIALTPNGAKLIDALQDKDIQRIAWQNHGFRSATGAENDIKALNLPGIPPNIENVIPMPRFKVMEKILDSLK